MTPEAIENDKNLGLPLIEVDKIYLDSDFNCRGQFSPMECIELAKDIARRGLQQPVVVRPLNDTPEELHLKKRGYTHIMIAGHRRLTAYKINNHDVIPCIVKPKDLSAFDAKDLNAVENLQRKELNLQQECQAIKHYWMAGWTREEVAERVGKSPGWVQIRYMLLEMPQEIQEAAGQGYIKTQDVRELNKYKNPVEQLKMAAIIRDRRKAGETRNVTAHIRKKDKATTKKHRGRSELFSMIEYLQDIFSKVDRDQMIPVNELITPGGNCIATSALAWAAGEITALEFHTALKDFCILIGLHYDIPDFSSKEDDPLSRLAKEMVE